MLSSDQLEKLEAEYWQSDMGIDEDELRSVFNQARSALTLSEEVERLKKERDRYQEWHRNLLKENHLLVSTTGEEWRQDRQNLSWKIHALKMEVTRLECQRKKEKAENRALKDKLSAAMHILDNCPAIPSEFWEARKDLQTLAQSHTEALKREGAEEARERLIRHFESFDGMDLLDEGILHKGVVFKNEVLEAIKKPETLSQKGKD